MKQIVHAANYSENFILMEKVTGIPSCWRQAWSKKLVSFQSDMVRSNERDILIKLDGAGAPRLRDINEIDSRSHVSPITNDILTLDLESECEYWLPELHIKELTDHDKLNIAIALARALVKIHKANILHFSLRPGSFLISKGFCHAEIIDFSAAKLCSKSTQGISAFETANNHSSYQSPEQSYLFEKVIDNRSDLYSLGCVLYWLFSKMQPFEELDNKAGINYAHMSCSFDFSSITMAKNKQATALKEIINKLVAKAPEYRYQSSIGLLCDLQTLQTNQSDISLIGGADDISDRIMVPQRLYGRVAELNILMQAFERVKSGQSEVLLIGGYSGVGKSALVDEVRMPIMQSNGLFISGKFEQFQRETPYGAIALAFGGFIDYILSLPSYEVALWRERLLNALGNNSQIIIDIIPQLSQLLGLQPEPAALGAEEQQNRFNQLFLSFIHQVCTVHKPLVLFIDDLQWADSASIKLLKLILADVSSQYCLIIGAYRDNEVDERHPFIRMLTQLELGQHNITKVTLPSLSQDTLADIIADTIKQPKDHVSQLAQLIFEKTAGNPFFFKQFLNELYQSELLTFDYDKAIWRWSVERIEQQSITDNVVQLMTRQLSRLPEQSVKLLQQAACIGSEFSLDSLACLELGNTEQLNSLLRCVLKAGLIQPVLNIPKQQNHSDEKFKFLHDMVQQAAYARNSLEERQAIHYKAGCYLLEQYNKAETKEHCFELVAHFNQAFILLDIILLNKVKQLNYQAALKAKSATAYTTAAAYLEKIFELDILIDTLLQSKAQTKAPELDEKLTLLAAIDKLECLFLSGDYERAEVFRNEVEDNCNPLELKIKLFGILITQYTRYGQLKRGIEISVQALALLQWPMLSSPSMGDITNAIKESQTTLKSTNFANLGKQKDIKDPQLLMTLDILIAMQPCCYNSGSLLFPLTILSLFKLTCQHGNSPYSSYIFMMYALLNTKVIKDYPLAFEAAKQSTDMMSHYPANPVLEGRLLMMNSNFVLPWKVPLQQSLEMRNNAYHLCLEHGDYYWGVHAYIFGFYADLLCTPSIEHLLNRSRNVVSTCELIKQPAQTYLSTLQCNLLEILQGSLDNQQNLDHEPGYEAAALDHFIDNHYMCGTYDRLLARLIQGYLFGNYQEALDIALAKDLNPEQLDEGIFHEAVYTQFNLLCILSLKQLAPESIAQHHEDWFASAWRKYQVWYAMTPENFSSGYHLIKAELAVIEQDELNAICHFEQAIYAAKRSGFALYQAIANERCGRYRLLQQQATIAKGYLQQAQSIYQVWGAHAKAADIAPLLDNAFISSSQIASQNLDWQSVVSASQDISKPLSRIELINRMLLRAVTATGAQYVALYQKQNTDWQLTAQCEQGKVSEQTSKPELYPKSVLNYCLNSGQTVVLKDASFEGEHLLDPYISRHQVRSVLCLLLKVRSEIVGVLYLEHKVAISLFTPQRCLAMELLAGQFAITYKNIVFYQTLKDNNKELEKAVSRRTVALDRQNQHLESVLKALPIPYVISEPDGTLLEANELFYEYFEVSKAEFEGSNSLKFYRYPRDRDRLVSQLESCGVLNDFECELKTYTDKPFWAQMSVTRVALESGQGIFSAISDISSRKKRERILVQQASTDPLTGAYNRRGLNELATNLKLSEQSQDMCVAMLDLDNFKKLNDTFGHAAGDEVLKEFVSKLKLHLRDEDVLGRVGGEEFALVLKGLDIVQAKVAMERICMFTEQMSVPFNNIEIKFTVSIGLATWHQEETLDYSIKRADSALYKAKQGGRNCVMYE